MNSDLLLSLSTPGVGGKEKFYGSGGGGGGGVLANSELLYPPPPPPPPPRILNYGWKGEGADFLISFRPPPHTLLNGTALSLFSKH